MRQSIFSAIPRILMETTGIDFVPGRRQETSFMDGSWGDRGDSALGENTMGT